MRRCFFFLLANYKKVDLLAHYVYYRTKQMPYKEEMEYTRALDDEEGNGFWRPSLLEIDGITFYLQVEKLGTTRNWYFYIQMEGKSTKRKKLAIDRFEMFFFDFLLRKLKRLRKLRDHDPSLEKPGE